MKRTLLLRTRCANPRKTRRDSVAAGPVGLRAPGRQHVIRLPPAQSFKVRDRTVHVIRLNHSDTIWPHKFINPAVAHGDRGAIGRGRCCLSSSWFLIGVILSCVSSRDHCRSNPVQVQSTEPGCRRRGFGQRLPEEKG